MRRHVMASTAGSAQRHATDPGCARTRKPTGLDSLLGAACVVASFLFVLVFAAPAFAGTVSNERPLLFTFDGSDTTAGAFTGSQRLGIDEASGKVYVMDAGHGVVDKFNPDGTAANFSATGTSSLSGAGTPQGSIELGGADGDISIDNSGGVTQGRIYIGGSSHPINAFSESGGYLWQLAPALFSNNCGTAVDAAGHLWVGDYGGFKAFEFDNTGSPPAQIGSVDTDGHICRLNVDASGNLFPVFYEGRVDKYVGGTFASTLDPGSNFDVAIDQSSATGHLFAIHGDSFSEYESSGALVNSFGTNLIGQGRGIAYNKALDRVYVADLESNTVKAFGPVASGTVPDVTTEASSELALHGAKFNGKINPLSLANSYHFEWKEGEGANWATAKSSPPQSIEPTDGSEHAVAFNGTGLKSNTTYQVRLVGTNAENGLSAYSSPSTLTTLSPPLPAVTISAPSPITTTTASVSGTVNPEGDTTTWRLQVSTDPACASGFSDQPSHDLGSEGTSPVLVSEELTGLLPNEHYCVRISASNNGGTTIAGKEFTTSPVIPDQVRTAFVAPRTATTARLNGYVNPHGATATYPLIYRFEYSKDGGTTWIALPDREYTGINREVIVVGEDLSGLSPSASYSYRFSAENAAGAASPQGGVEAFTTHSSAEVAAPLRGIELVNNPAKGNQNIFSSVEDASPMDPGGESALWSVNGGAPGGTASSGNAFLAERSANGWSSRNLIPPPSQQVGNATFTYSAEKATPDLEHFVFAVGRNGPIGLDGKTLVRLDRGQHQDVLATFESAAHADKGEISDDGAHVLIVNPDSRQLEDIGGSSPELISVMPGGSPAECGLDPNGESFVGISGNRRGAGNNWSPGYRMMEVEDASRVYFEAKPDGNCENGLYGLYERKRAAGETTLIDAGSLEHHVEFIRATPDGRHAYFMTYSQLDSADQNSGADVYRWDEAADESVCLTCVVPNANIEHNPVMVSDDFSHIYFKSEAQLVPGEGTAGELDTYVLSSGTIRFVGGRGVGALEVGESLLSPDGSVLVFRSAGGGGTAGLTSDKLPAKCTSAAVHKAQPSTCRQVYRYDDHDGSIECLSCRHDGETTWQAGSSFINPESDFKMSRDGSTVAFVTLEALLPEDVNQGADVYEWRNGAIHLITDGVRAFQEGFAAPQVRAVSNDGGSILFIAAAPGLTGFEQDGLSNLYVARIGGGFEPPAPPVQCSGDSCQGPLEAPPPQQQPDSTSFSGHGNGRKGSIRRRCAKSKTRRHGRCVSRHAHKGRHKRVSHANQGRAK